MKIWSSQLYEANKNILRVTLNIQVYIEGHKYILRVALNIKVYIEGDPQYISIF